jgi:hypothetical protein
MVIGKIDRFTIQYRVSSRCNGVGSPQKQAAALLNDGMQPAISPLAHRRRNLGSQQRGGAMISDHL